MQPIGLDVFDGHALRDVERDDQVDPMPAHLHLTQIDERPGRRERERRDGEDDEHGANSLPRAADRAESCATPGETREGAPARHERGEVQQTDGHRDESEQCQLGMDEPELVEVHGTRLSTVVASMTSSRTAPSAPSKNGNWTSCTPPPTIRVPTRERSSDWISR